jgi:hypothetical protein
MDQITEYDDGSKVTIHADTSYDWDKGYTREQLKELARERYEWAERIRTGTTQD